MRTRGENNLHPFFDFLARYVRKLHSDRHIKNTLSSNPGMSFLDMIGASDIAYVVTLVKNSYALWSYDPAGEDEELPKALFTRGETKKREFGKTTMSKDGIKFFQKGMKNWKKTFSARDDPVYRSMKENWDKWLADDSGAVDSRGWRRKSIHKLLGTREEDNASASGDEGSDGEENNSGAESEDNADDHGYSYDSDGEVGGYIKSGGENRDMSVARSGQQGTTDFVDDEDEEEDIEDDGGRANYGGYDDSVGEDNKKSPYNDNEECPPLPPLHPVANNRRNALEDDEGDEADKPSDEGEEQLLPKNNKRGRPGAKKKKPAKKTKNTTKEGEVYQ